MVFGFVLSSFICMHKMDGSFCVTGVQLSWNAIPFPSSLPHKSQKLHFMKQTRTSLLRRKRHWPSEMRMEDRDSWIAHIYTVQSIIPEIRLQTNKSSKHSSYSMSYSSYSTSYSDYSMSYCSYVHSYDNNS